MSESPELENWREIEERLKGGPDSVQMAVGQAMQNVTLGLVNLQYAIRGPVLQISEQLKKFNENIDKASNSSEKLTRAIKNATWAGVGVAAIALGWDLIKTFFLNS